jgi:hypothetical protein
MPEELWSGRTAEAVVRHHHWGDRRRRSQFCKGRPRYERDAVVRCHAALDPPFSVLLLAFCRADLRHVRLLWLVVVDYGGRLEKQRYRRAIVTEEAAVFSATSRESTLQVITLL